jgi:MFS family permease
MRDATIWRVWGLRFFSGLMFWYGIEQLFLDNTIQDQSGRAWVITAFAISILAFNLPAGIIADKIGRKHAIVISTLVFIIALYLLASSQTILQYFIGTLLYGLYWSLFANSLSAYLYDYLCERKSQKSFARYQGIAWGAMFAGAALGNALSGTVAHTFGIQNAYFFSYISVFAMVGVALSLRHFKTHQLPGESHGSRFSKVRAALQDPYVQLFSLRRVLGTVIYFTIIEFGQVYLLAYHFDMKTVGYMWSLTAIVCLIAYLITPLASKRPEASTVLYIAVLLAFSFIVGPVGIVLFFLLYGLNEMMGTVYDTEIHHRIPSSVRATIISLITFTGTGIGLLVAWGFNAIHITNGIFMADRTAGIAAALLFSMSVAGVFLLRFTKLLRRKAF